MLSIFDKTLTAINETRSTLRLVMCRTTNTRVLVHPFFKKKKFYFLFLVEERVNQV